MDPFTAVAIASTVIQIAGQWNANSAASDQERRNAAWYQEQAMYAKAAAERQEALSWFESSYKISTQASKFAGSGIDLSGSAQVTIGGTIAQAVKEIWAIREKGRMEYTLAASRGQQAQSRADMYSDTGYNLLQAGTIGISNYTQFRAASYRADGSAAGTIRVNAGGASSAGAGMTNAQMDAARTA